MKSKKKKKPPNAKTHAHLLHSKDLLHKKYSTRLFFHFLYARERACRGFRGAKGRLGQGLIGQNRASARAWSIQGSRICASEEVNVVFLSTRWASITVQTKSTSSTLCLQEKKVDQITAQFGTCQCGGKTVRVRVNISFLLGQPHGLEGRLHT